MLWLGKGAAYPVGEGHSLVKIPQPAFPSNPHTHSLSSSWTTSLAGI